MDLWRKHPHVRTGDQLTFGERAADGLKRVFGSWRFLLSMVTGIIAWIIWNKATPRGWHFDTTDLLLLNLCLSIVAGLQGGALQIASNRGDRISSEVAVHTYQNGRQLLEMNQEILDISKQQSTILLELRRMRAARDPADGHAEAPLPERQQDI